MTDAADSRAGTGALVDILSVERFGRYLSWAGGDHQRALDLYALNTRLSEALYTPLQMLEVVLRNRINRVMQAAHGADWLVEGRIVLLPHQRAQVDDAITDLAKEGRTPGDGRLVAALTFSFWTTMLGPQHEQLWRTTLHEVARRADGRHLARKDLSRPLTPTRVLRNRIAHHEPILHWDLRRHHAVIMQTMAWLAPKAAEWCTGLDRFPSVHPEEGYTLFTPSRANE